jgi:hypothetical protein
MSGNSEAIKSLEDEYNFLEDPDKDSEDLIIPSENITKAQAIQNEDSTWSVVEYEEKNPNELHSTIVTRDSDNRDKQISDLGQITTELDKQLKDINDQINSKKTQIVSTITTAVGAGCSMIQLGFNILFPLLPPTILVDAGDVNGTGVAIGAGLTVSNDTASLKIYSNLTNYTSDNPFEVDVTESITYSNAGDGYVSFVGNNDGSIVSSNYKEIDTSPLIPPPNQATCVSYYNTITTLANEINSLRSQRDSLSLSDVNTVKQERLNQQLQDWGVKSTDASVETRRTGISSVIVSIQNLS